MSDRSKMSRLAIAALLAAAVTAPSAASAMQYAPSSVQGDMHASTVVPPGAANQDLRTEGAISPSRPADHPRGADLRTENAADPSRAPEPPAGLPTWPVDPKPIAPVSPQPVAGDGDGGDVEWPIAVLALMGALALGGGIAVAGQRLRTQARPAH